MIYYGRVVSYDPKKTTIEFTIASLGQQRRFVGEVSGNNYSPGDRIIVGRVGGVRSEGFMVIGNLTRSLISGGDELAEIVNTLDELDEKIGSLEANVQTLGANLSWLEFDVEALEQTSSSQEVEIGSLSSRTLSLEGDYTSLNNAVNQKINRTEITPTFVWEKVWQYGGGGINATTLEGYSHDDIIQQTEVTKTKILELIADGSLLANLNADKLDSLDSTQLYRSLASTSNADAATSFGAAPGTGLGPFSGATSVETLPHGSGGLLQRVVDATGRIAQRVRNSGVWGSWQELARKSDLPTVPVIMRGVSSVTFSSASYTSVNISYGFSFSAHPRVLVTVAGAPGGSASVVLRTLNHSASGCSVYGYSATGANITTTVPFHWLAIEA